MTNVPILVTVTAALVGAGYKFIRDESTGIRKDMDELKVEMRGGFEKLSTKLDGVG
jgi:hypothetical protein